MIEDLIKQLVNSSMARKDANGFTYVPTMARQQQEQDNAYKDAALTGYYSTPDLRNTLDQIQANKNINMSTQDETARTNAQQQNHALYSVLKNRYGIDGESQFNTADNNVNSQNLASAYKGNPTMAKLQTDASMTGYYNGLPTMAKQQMDTSNNHWDSSFGLQKDQFNFSKDKYNFTEGSNVYTNRVISKILGEANSEQDALTMLQELGPQMADKGIDMKTIYAVIKDRFPAAKIPLEKTPTPKDRADLIKIYSNDPSIKDQYGQVTKSFDQWLQENNLGK